MAVLQIKAVEAEGGRVITKVTTRRMGVVKHYSHIAMSHVVTREEDRRVRCKRCTGPG